jgi:hypothetical protein
MANHTPVLMNILDHIHMKNGGHHQHVQVED